MPTMGPVEVKALSAEACLAASFSGASADALGKARVTCLASVVAMGDADAGVLPGDDSTGEGTTDASGVD